MHLTMCSDIVAIIEGKAEGEYQIRKGSVAEHLYSAHTVKG